MVAREKSLKELTPETTDEFWREEFTDLSRWGRMPDAVANPSGDYHAVRAFDAEEGAEVAHFYIADSGKSMQWLRRIPTIPLEHYQYLVLRYKAHNTLQPGHFIELSSGMSDEAVILEQTDLKADGVWHTIAVDIGSITRAPFTHGFTLRLQSGPSDVAHLWLCYLSFAHRPPEGADIVAHPPQPALAAQCWSEHFDSPPLWQADPNGLLEMQPLAHEVTYANSIGHFVVQGAFRGMLWVRNVDPSVDLRAARYLVLKYRAKGINPHHVSGGDTHAPFFISLGVPRGYLSTSQGVALVQHDLVADGAWHTEVVDTWHCASTIGPMTEVALQLQADERGRADLWIDRLELTDTLPSVPLDEMLPFEPEWSDLLLPLSELKPLPLRDQWNTGIAALGHLGIQEWPSQPNVSVEGIPFVLGSQERCLMGTEIWRTGDLEIPVGQSATELYLLLAGRFVGEDEPSMGSGRLKTVRQVERFIIELIYADGGKDSIFPAQFGSGLFQITERPGVYVLAPSRSEVITKMVVRDRMRGGALYLAALTLNIGSRRLRPELAEQTPAKLKVVSSIEDITPATLRIEDDTVSLENAHLRYDLALQPGLRLVEFRNKIINDNLIRATEGSPIFEVELEGLRVDSSDFFARKITSSHDSELQRVVIDLAARQGGAAAQLTGVLSLSLGSGPELTTLLTLRNRGRRPLKIKAFFPVLREAVIGTNPKSNTYFYPRMSAVVSSYPTLLREPYSGRFPLQVMGLSDLESGGGGYILVHDTDDVYKYFVLEKDSRGSRLEVEYPESALAPGETLGLCEAALGVHAGDWHASLEAYRRWVATWYHPLVPRKQWFREVFNFRQYYCGAYGTGWNVPGMYDHETGTYQPQKAIQEAQAFGGCDYLHIFDWGLSRHHGRTGDYSHYEDIGGLPAFAEGIRACQALGVPVGLYIEGHLCSTKSLLASRVGRSWQRKTKNGEWAWWPQSDEMFMCPNHPGWQEHLASTYRRVIQETGVNGVYIDQFGLADPRKFCYAEGHGHPIPTSPLRGEREITRRVRESASQAGKDVAVYTEFTPSDVNSQFQDGSFTYVVFNTQRHWSPVALNIFRFALPDFKNFEIMVCDRPTGSSVTSVKQVFFNGDGTWIQGAPDEWFAPETLATMRRAYRILHDHADVFTSADVTPLVATQRSGIYANRFSTAEKEIYTLFNGRYASISGEILRLPYEKGGRYVDLWNQVELVPRIERGEAIISMALGPRDAGCVMRVRP